MEMKTLNMAAPIKVNTDTTPSVYANNAEVQVTTWDFRFKFGEIETITEKEITVAERVRVAMSPQHAKVFSKVLAENLANYEKAFGEIQVEANTKKP